MAIEEIIVIKGDTGNAVKNLRDLTETISEQKDITIELEKELRNLQLEYNNTSKAAFNPQRNKLVKDIAHVKGALADQRTALKDLNNEKRKASASIKNYSAGLNKTGLLMRTLNGLTGGLASTFLDVANAAKLSGRAMKSALISSGIGLLLIAVTSIYENWEKISDFISGANKEIEKQLELNKTNNERLDHKLTILKEEETLLKLQGKSTEQNQKEQVKVIKLLQLENEERLDLLQAQLKKEISLATELGLIGKIVSITKGMPIVKTVDDEEIEKIKKVQKDIDDAKIRSLKLKQAILEINKPEIDKNNDDEEKKEKQKVDDIERIRKGLIITEKQQRAEKLRVIKVDYDEQIKLAEKHYGKESEKVKELKKAQRAALAEQQLKFNEEDGKEEKKRLENIEKIRDKFNKKLEEREDLDFLDKLERQKQRDLLELEQLKATKEQKAELVQYYADLEREYDQNNILETIDYEDQAETEAEDKRLARLGREAAGERLLIETKKKIREENTNNALSGLNILSSLFKKNKALQIGSIIAENAVAISRNIVATQAANQAIRVQGKTLSFATAGASVLAGEAMVKLNNISSIKSIAASVAAAAQGISALGGGGSSGVAPPSDSSSAPAPSAPSFNLVQGTDSNQIAESIQNNNNQPIEAFVVGSNVTSQQELDNNKIQIGSI